MATFFDVHCHAFNLHHPSLIAFLKRVDLTSYLFLNAIPGVGAASSIVIGKKFSSAMNLLSVMENDIENIFRLMEEDVRSIRNKGRLADYDHFVLTPLVMDFGTKRPEEYNDIHYRKLAGKPVVRQVADLFAGIAKYCATPGNLFEILSVHGCQPRQL